MIVIVDNLSSFNHLRSMNITFCKCEFPDMFIIHRRLCNSNISFLNQGHVLNENGSKR